MKKLQTLLLGLSSQSDLKPFSCISKKDMLLLQIIEW